MTLTKCFATQSFPSRVCKLNKALYGLKQAPRVWFQKLKTTLQSWGFTNAVLDASLFIQKKGPYFTYTLVYVENILVTCISSTKLDVIIKKFHKTFALKELGLVNYFLGFDATKTTNGYTLC